MSDIVFNAFAQLAEQLNGLARHEGFLTHRLRLGPLDISLCIAPDCVQLNLPSAFAGLANLYEPPSRQATTSTDTLTVFILRLPNPTIERSLSHVLSVPTKTLQQLSNRHHTEQFVINDGERKTLRLFDQVNLIGLLAFADQSLLPPWEFFSPIKEFIHLHALNQSCLLFHGATLVPSQKSEFGALLVGPGGSGKSTLTAHAIEQGMLTTGDDYVLVDLNHDRPQCHAVYRTFKLHPTSPVLQESHRWQPWRTDSVTGKSVMLADTVANGGSLVARTTLSVIFGLSLRQSSEVFNPKAQSILSDPSRHPYLHSSMSTVQQMPYRIDATLNLAKKLHQAIPYQSLTIAPGIIGLKQVLATIKVTLA